MTLDAAATLIGQLGFPIFVAAYLLIRIESLIRRLLEMEAQERQLLRDLQQTLAIALRK